MYAQGFLRYFRDPIRVRSIRENYHRVPRIRENRVPTGPYWVPNIFLKNTRMYVLRFLLTNVMVPKTG